jgi:ssDNA-specific exonuclease RecJ
VVAGCRFRGVQGGFRFRAPAYYFLAKERHFLIHSKLKRLSTLLTVNKPRQTFSMFFEQKTVQLEHGVNRQL